MGIGLTAGRPGGHPSGSRLPIGSQNDSKGRATKSRLTMRCHIDPGTDTGRPGHAAPLRADTLLGAYSNLVGGVEPTLLSSPDSLPSGPFDRHPSLRVP